jgi:hypothetical protein
MKRDMELARSILLEIEKSPTYMSSIDFKFEGYSEELVSYHILLLNEAGLIIATDVSSSSDLNWIPERLTWQGHEFLEASRNLTAWNKTKEIMTKSGGFVFEVAKTILIEIIKNQLSANI